MNLYWFQSGADDLWDTLTGNWWTDAAHSIQSGRLPQSGDSLYFLGTTQPSTGPAVLEHYALIDTTGITIAPGVWALDSNISLADGGTLELGTADPTRIQLYGSGNVGTIAVANIYPSAQNTGTLNGPVNLLGGNNAGNITGGPVVVDAGVNTGTITIDGSVSFINGGLNSGGTVVGDATFATGSNGGTVTGNAIFNGPSIATDNEGVVAGDATFLGGSVNSGGTVGGVATISSANSQSGTWGTSIVITTDVSFGGNNTFTLDPPTVITGTGKVTFDANFSFVLVNGAVQVATNGADAALGASYVLGLGL